MEISRVAAHHVVSVLLQGDSDAVTIIDTISPAGEEVAAPTVAVACAKPPRQKLGVSK